jgi:putative membrane protein
VRLRELPAGARRFVRPGAVLLIAVVPSTLRAHAGRPPEPHDVLQSWDPPVATLFALALCGWLYGRGVCAAWAQAGRDRGVARSQVHAFAAGLAVLAVAIASPLDAVAAALFSAHMVQHLLLVLVAGPLLAAGRAELVLLWAAPERMRRRIGRLWAGATRLRRLANAVSQPASAWVLHAVALWIWHLPRLYDAAAADEATHALEHASFVVTSILFARALPLGVRGGRSRLSHGAAILYLFAGAMQSALLGALLALAPVVWYTAHLTSTVPWGLRPLEDQHLAGTIMWGPAGVAYAAAALWMMHAWLANAAGAVSRRPGGVVSSGSPRARRIRPADGAPVRPLVE